MQSNLHRPAAVGVTRQSCPMLRLHSPLALVCSGARRQLCLLCGAVNNSSSSAHGTPARRRRRTTTSLQQQQEITPSMQDGSTASLSTSASLDSANSSKPASSITSDTASSSRSSASNTSSSSKAPHRSRTRKGGTDQQVSTYRCLWVHIASI